MRSLASLREQRASRVDVMRSITDRASNENRDLNDQEQSAFDAARGEVERTDREIRNAEFLAEAERRSEAEPVSGRGENLGQLERRFQVGKALSEFQAGRLTGVEAEWAAEHRSGRAGAISMPASLFLGGELRSALTTTTPSGGPGSNLIPTELGALIDRHRPRLAVEGLGATVLRGLTGNLDLPRLKASGGASWVAEHAAPTATDPQFDKVSMAPKTVSAQYEISRKMMLQATSLESILRSDIGFLLAQALDAAAIKGDGTDEPTGILATSGISVVALGTNGAAHTIDTAADLIGAVEAVDALGNTGFLTNSKVKKASLKLKDSQSRPYDMATIFKGELVAFSNQVPSNLTKGTGTALSAILYGVWSELVIGYWSSVDIVINPYADSVASKGGALLHAFLDADIALRHADAFAVAKDVITA